MILTILETGKGVSARLVDFFSQDGSRDFASDAEVRTLLREGAVELLVGFRRGVGWHHLVNTWGFWRNAYLIEKQEKLK